VLVRACRVEELAEGKGKMVELDGECIALFRSGAEVVAVDNECPHRGGALAGGDLHGGAVHCPLHGWPFDARTGRCLEQAGVRVRTFPVEVRGGEVWVEV
jgi:NAD(P)H-dependent nitrite reductase small subunit